MATIKETGTNDKGLLEFYTDYFGRHAIYMDEKWELYRAMGGRKISAFKLIQRLAMAQMRYAKKRIFHSAGNANPKAANSNWMMGGVLVFNRKGELTYVLEESVGRELDMERIEAAIDEARTRSSSDSSDGGNSSMDLSEVNQKELVEDYGRRSNSSLPTIDDTSN